MRINKDNATSYFLNYVRENKLVLDIDNFSDVSQKIFNQQEIDYLSGKGYRLFSMLTLALLQMGLIEM